MKEKKGSFNLAFITTIANCIYIIFVIKRDIKYKIKMLVAYSVIVLLALVNYSALSTANVIFFLALYANTAKINKGSGGAQTGGTTGTSREWEDNNTGGFFGSGGGQTGGTIGTSREWGAPNTIETIKYTDTTRTIWDFLKGKGFTDIAAAGIMGNFQAESALIPNNLQNSFKGKLGYTDTSYTAAVDSGAYTKFTSDNAGYGLAQWTYGARKEGLLKYAQRQNKSVGDLNVQLEYMWIEMSRGGYLAIMNAFTTIKAASDFILKNYEQPANQGAGVQNERAGYAQGFYDTFSIK